MDDTPKLDLTALAGLLETATNGGISRSNRICAREDLALIAPDLAAYALRVTAERDEAVKANQALVAENARLGKMVAEVQDAALHMDFLDAIKALPSVGAP